MRTLAALLVLPSALLLAAEPPSASPAYPAVVGDHVGPHARAHWPARVRSLDRVEWDFRGGQHLGNAVPGRDGMVRLQAGGGVIHGLDAATGELRWKAGGIHRFFNYSSCALGPDGTAYGGNHRFLTAVGPDGNVRWQAELGAGWIHRPPAVSPDGRTVFFASDGVTLASLDAATGRVNWLRRDLGKHPWIRMCFDGQGRLVAGLRDRVVCFAANGGEAWSRPGRPSFLLWTGSRLILGQEKSLAAYDPETEKVLWKAELGRKISGLALGDDYRLVAALQSGEVAQIDHAGAVRWIRRVSDEALGRPATARGGETLVVDGKGVLFLLDSNGAVIDSLETGAPGWRWRPAVGPDGRVYVNQKDRVVCVGGDERPPPRPLRATEMTAVADDFVVDVWVNGRLLPLSARKRVAEIFGATTERIRTDLREGDWVVFHAVANRMRWSGVNYFGVHATDDDRQVAFVSDTKGGWYVCEEPAEVPAFIREREAGADRPAGRSAKPWSGGDERWRKLLPDGQVPGRAALGRWGERLDQARREVNDCLTHSLPDSIISESELAGHLIPRALCRPKEGSAS